jgi:uncharacterized protein YbcC (UPF0753/DUF2309 family)
MTMSASVASRAEEDMLHHLAHYLPSQAPLKDFIHHNTLHAFQHRPFHQGCVEAEVLFGFHTRLSLKEYRAMYSEGKINHDVLMRVAGGKLRAIPDAAHALFEKDYSASRVPRIGALRDQWKTVYRLNLDKEVHPVLFRLLAAYIDQGISIWQFPKNSGGFISAVKALESQSLISLFKSEFVRNQFLHEEQGLTDLLTQIVGTASLHERYLFDQQFAHPGWSGMVNTVANHPEALLDKRSITLREMIMLELYLELDALDARLGEERKLLGELITPVEDLFSPVRFTELDEVLNVWQEAMEWSYYDQVIAGIACRQEKPSTAEAPSFQAMFCIDDRECSIRRHIEKYSPDCQTYGTPGFFNVEFYFQPEHSMFHTKVCPAPVHPRHLIIESNSQHRHIQDRMETRHGHGLLGGWLASQTIGFAAAVRMVGNVLFPRRNKLMVSSSAHMDPKGRLSIEYDPELHHASELQVGFTLSEMADRVEGLLRSIGLVSDFAPLVYVIGHGASSLNNTYYAGYDCGACSGRPGSVNARVFAFMANHHEVRNILSSRGIEINPTTRFVSGLHDTTMDEFHFYDDEVLTPEQTVIHRTNTANFSRALDDNSKERSRRFILTESSRPAREVHEDVSRRAYSFFEPRPELNHATNALCIIGRRSFTRHLYLDRRAFLNSYDYTVDPEGVYLTNILGAATPVCGGINLEYYFSRMDNARLGAGSKLPHNVVGLIGLANGTDGDLRPGLPSQMVEMHTPLRLLMIVEQFPDVVLQSIQARPQVWEWYNKEWVNLISVDPVTKVAWRFNGESFTQYTAITQHLPELSDVLNLDRFTEEDLPVFHIR